jgi:hypothetical protein
MHVCCAYVCVCICLCLYIRTITLLPNLTDWGPGIVMHLFFYGWLFFCRQDLLGLMLSHCLTGGVIPGFPSFQAGHHHSASPGAHPPAHRHRIAHLHQVAHEVTRRCSPPSVYSPSPWPDTNGARVSPTAARTFYNGGVARPGKPWVKKY